MARPRRAALADIQERGQSLESGSSASSLAGLGPQYARAGPWYSAESNKPLPTGGQAAAQALYAYLSLGICWDERPNGILSFRWPDPTREQVRSREAEGEGERGVG
jgi:hypothetical protein